MQSTLKTMLKKGLRSRFSAQVLAAFIRNAIRVDPDLVDTIGLQRSRGLLNLHVSEDVERLLTEIPSMTFLSERLFLYNLFRCIWPGTDHVLEIGSFLGGTTRAIALGMQHNPRKTGNCRLFTHDCLFGEPVSDVIRPYVEQLINRDTFPSDKAARIRRCSAFKEAYELIHDNAEYADALAMRCTRLPQTKEDLRDLGNGQFLDKGVRYSAVFVDGCKSWFSTKHFFREISVSISIGSLIIFQDYGYYQTFWIPAFVEAFREHFVLFAHAHNTYAFVLTRELSQELVENRFPDDVGAEDLEYLNRQFSSLIQDAAMRRDSYATFAHRLQYAASHAYVGQREKARHLIRTVGQDPHLGSYERKLVESALASPTYRPSREAIVL